MRIFLFFLLVFLGISNPPSVYAQAPVADFYSSVDSGCAPLVVSFTSTSSGSPASYHWDFGNGSTSTFQNPSTSYLSAGTYTVSLTVTNASGSNTKTVSNFITVYGAPVVNFSANPASGCPPLNVQFINTSNPGTPGPATYSWSFGDGSSLSALQSPAHTYLNSGLFNVTLTVINSGHCVTSFTKAGMIDVFTPPAGSFTANPTMSCYPPATVNFTGSAGGSGPFSYSWNFGNGGAGAGSTAQTTYQTSGSFSPSLIVTDIKGCRDTLIKPGYISVGTTKAAFSASAACPFSAVVFNNNSTDASSYLWIFGDGNSDTAQSPQHIYTASGTYQVTLVAIKGPCRDSLTLPVTVHPKPVADYKTTPERPCPAPAAITFVNQSTGATNYWWNFGDGDTSDLAAPIHTYQTNDTFFLTLIATNQFGCKDTLYRRDTIFPIENQLVPEGVEGCLPLTFSIEDTLFSRHNAYGKIIYPYYPIDSIFWDFGNGVTSTSFNPSHTITVRGASYGYVRLVTSNGCVVRDSFLMQAGNKPVADFIFWPDTVCVMDRVYVKNLSTPANDYEWDFGDQPLGIHQFEPSYQYLFPGTYYIKLIADDYGCKDTFTTAKPAVVNPPGARYIVDYNCDTPTRVKFTDASISATSYLWDFGGGITYTIRDVTHDFPDTGIYQVKLITYNDTFGCRDTAIKDIRIIDPDLSFFTADTAICKGDSIVFYPDFTDSVLSAFTWFIDFNKPDWPYPPGSDPNPSYNEWGYRFKDTGVYTISVNTVDMNECPHTAVRKNYVLVAKPEADFVASPTLGCVPMPVRFMESSSNVTGAFSTVREWDFSNGRDTVTTDTTSRIYNNPGNYSVRLILTDNVGCKDTLLKQNLIEARKATASFIATDTSACIGETIHFSNTSQGQNLTYEWDFGDNTGSTSRNPGKSYGQTGNYTVSLIVTDDAGCKDTMIKTAYVKIKKPAASFTMNDSFSICPPLNVVFTNTTAGVNSWQWIFGDGTGSVLQNPVATYTMPGIYNIRLIATNSDGCQDTARATATVLGYDGALSYTPLTGCAPLTVSFTAQLKNVPNILWDFSDGIVIPSNGTDTIVHTYQSSGAYLPKLILSNNTGCQNSSQGIDTIRVDDVFAGFEALAPCERSPVVFSDTSGSAFSAINDWQWSTLNGSQISNSQNPVFSFPVPGNYPVTLVITNEQGCKDTITQNVTIYPLPVISAGKDTAICIGDAAKLLASGGVSYTWLPDTTLSCIDCADPMATPSVLTRYFLTGTDEHGCQNKDTVKVNIQLLTSSEAGKGGEICEDSVFRLLAYGAERYEWKPAETLDNSRIPDPVAKPQATTVYTVTAWEGSCPPDSHQIKVIVFPKPVVNAGPDITIVAGTSAILSGSGSNISGFAWSPPEVLSCEACSSPTAAPMKTTVFKLTGTSEKGCRNTDEVTIFVLCDQSQVFIPNTFSPNNDGRNDVFYPRGEGLQTISSFRVYNRWGEKVFEKNNIPLNDALSGWDGSYKGTVLSPDVFVYIVEAVCSDGSPIQWKGDISLIR